jgi:hypothetical protein
MLNVECLFVIQKCEFKIKNYMEELNSELKAAVNKRFEELFKHIGNNRVQLANKVSGVHRELNKELSKETIDEKRKVQIMIEVSKIEKMAAQQLPHMLRHAVKPISENPASPVAAAPKPPAPPAPVKPPQAAKPVAAKPVAAKPVVAKPIPTKPVAKPSPAKAPASKAAKSAKPAKATKTASAKRAPTKPKSAAGKKKK